ncbi:HNH endonuclease [Arthrobacter globiformis]|uniref:HNH endonuclease n=1 Tax=Arthrobacter globiformis TaxID=1665 RepID=UPI0027D89089|nr:HNH endonuclease signature motif containing protein [Arthrobacter globiformis]
MARAGSQCEMEAGLRRRCAKPAEHGDHFYPWSKGGSTSLQNFVAACSKCNRAQGARVPSPGHQRRIERRRREYLRPKAPSPLGNGSRSADRGSARLGSRTVPPFSWHRLLHRCH